MTNYTNNFFGLDLGTTGIRIVQLFRRGDNYDLLAAGSLPNSTNIQTCEDPQKIQTLAEKILQLRKECGVTCKNVTLSIPEEYVYTQLIEFPKLPDKQLQETIRWESESFVPIPLEEVELDWKIFPISGEKDKVFVFIVAAPLLKINKITDLLQFTKLNVINIESSIISTSRAIIDKQEEKETVLMLNIGFENSELAIIKNGVILATRKLPLGGDTITRALVSNLSLEWKLAEKTKLNLKNVEGEIGEKIKGYVNSVIINLSREVRRSIHYFKEKYDDLIVTKVVVTGHTVAMHNFKNLFQEKLNNIKTKEDENLEVSIGNPWSRVAKSQSIEDKSPEAKYSFSVAVGLAMKKL